MSGLPAKPDAVAHVSDGHWRLALNAAAKSMHFPDWQYLDPINCDYRDELRSGAIDHARCLVLLGEVTEPVDPITLAASHVWHVANGPHCDAVPRIEAAMREHLAGITFPEQST